MHEHTRKRLEEVYEARLALSAKMEARSISAEGRLKATESRQEYERKLRKLQDQPTPR